MSGEIIYYRGNEHVQKLSIAASVKFVCVMMVKAVCEQKTLTTNMIIQGSFTENMASFISTISDTEPLYCRISRSCDRILQ